MLYLLLHLQAIALPLAQLSGWLNHSVYLNAVASKKNPPSQRKQYPRSFLFMFAPSFQVCLSNIANVDCVERAC